MDIENLKAKVSENRKRRGIVEKKWSALKIDWINEENRYKKYLEEQVIIKGDFS